MRVKKREGESKQKVGGVPTQTKNSKRYLCQHICNVQMGSRRAIYNDIAASTSYFFRPRLQNCRAEGPRARPSSRECCCRGRKKIEVEAPLSLYRARRDPKNIIDISLCFMSQVSKEFTKAVPRAMDQAANPKLNDIVIKEILFF